MELQYKLKIENPLINQVEIKVIGIREKNVAKLRFYIPLFCPPSLTLQNYSNNILGLMVTNKQGELLSFERLSQNIWEINFDNSETKGPIKEFVISYRVSCKKRSPFFSYIDITHAYLLGADLLVGVEGADKFQISFDFPSLWSKINTALVEVSKKSEEFVFSAPDYQTLISTPILIGCHETDGFRINGIDHYLSFNKEIKDLKKDLIAIVTVIEKLMGPLKFSKYHFILDFIQSKSASLGFYNTTTIFLDGGKLKSKKRYYEFLGKVIAHYLKSYDTRRPDQDFSKEVHSNFLWVQDGLESFISGIILLKAKIITQKDFLDIYLKKIITFTEMPGKKFQALMESSFSYWRITRDENLNVNRSLKGFILFSFLLSQVPSKKIKILIRDIYQNPEKVFSIVSKILDAKKFDKFETYATTTEDLDFYFPCTSLGLMLKTSRREIPYLGAKGAGLKIKSCILDGPFYKAGIMKGDQILKVNGKKTKGKTLKELLKTLKAEKYCNFLIQRGLNILEMEVFVEKEGEKVSKLTISDAKKFENFLEAF